MWTYKANVQRVIDGDTLQVSVDLGFYHSLVMRVRLLGIDTPETYGVKKDSEEYAKGMEAKNRVQELLDLVGGNVLIKTEKAGKFGRWLADVLPADADGAELWDGPSINQILLDEGLAKEYPK